MEQIEQLDVTEPPGPGTPKDNNLKARGTKAMLPHGGLPEVFSPYLRDLIIKTGGANGPIGKQFVANPELECKYFQNGVKDPLIEDEFEVAPGLIYKYRGKVRKDGSIYSYGRVLWTITRFCASYCRFCTRGREIGLPTNYKVEGGSRLTKEPFLRDEEIDEVIKFLKEHKEINEVILSGGDPLTTPLTYLGKIIDKLVNLQKNGDIRIIRIGSRLPIHNPRAINVNHYKLVAKIKNPYLMVHINHPEELTDEAIMVLNNFRRHSFAVISSQTVFLKGVNDNTDTLHDLFVKMAENGIRPYYMYQNDPVYWAKHFTVPMDKAFKIWEELRPRLSGIAATARFVIDTPFGFGKIPVPEGGAWDFKKDQFRDFKGTKFKV
jgi:lysine 2,3-aminomutase